MLRHISLGALAIAVSANLALAQTIVIPAGYQNTPGGTSNAFPFANLSTTYAGLRIQFVYDSSEFTSQSISSPILITGLKFRAYPTTSSWTGGTYTTANIIMGEAVDYLATSTNYPGNYVGTPVTVHSGPVTLQPGTGNGPGVAGPWHIDITFNQSPFLYDPSSGNDLAIEFDNPTPGANWSGGTTIGIDHISGYTTGRRVYGSSNYPAANGVDQYIACLELSYQPGVGFATRQDYGTGCNEAFASFYENFGSFDLSNSSLDFTNTGSGYLVLQGSTPWHTPTGTPVTMLDDDVQQFSLGFPFPYPGGTTTDIWISSNGFVYGVPTTNNGCCSGNVSMFLSSGPCWSALWGDLNPSATGGGTVTFETDPVAGNAYITFDQVPQFGTSNFNTFQYAFHSSGQFELVYQSCTSTAAFVGWSPGQANNDPGSMDISASSVILLNTDIEPLKLDASARPVLGTSLDLTIDNISPTTPLSAVIYGLSKIDPGLPLASIGMPDCYQYVSQDAVQLLFGQPAVTVPFAVPNVTALVGVHIACQGASYDPGGGHNTLGARSTHGIEFVLDVN